MSYRKLEPQPEARSAELGWDEPGDGLYPGEIALRLGSGQLVAVSIDQHREGANIVLKGCARWIDGKGRVRSGADRAEVEIVFPLTVSPAFAAAKGGIETVQRELVLALLGEPATMIDVDGEDLPLLDLGEQVRAAISIREAIAAARAAAPLADIGRILEL
jgi:hypothetical protein